MSVLLQGLCRCHQGSSPDTAVLTLTPTSNHKRLPLSPGSSRITAVSHRAHARACSLFLLDLREDHQPVNFQLLSDLKTHRLLVPEWRGGLKVQGTLAEYADLRRQPRDRLLSAVDGVDLERFADGNALGAARAPGVVEADVDGRGFRVDEIRPERRLRLGSSALLEEERLLPQLALLVDHLVANAGHLGVRTKWEGDKDVLALLGHEEALVLLDRVEALEQPGEALQCWRCP